MPPAAPAGSVSASRRPPAACSAPPPSSSCPTPTIRSSCSGWMTSRGDGARADPADYTAWRLRDERIEVADGRRGLHFTVDLPASIALDAVPHLRRRRRHQLHIPRHRARLHPGPDGRTLPLHVAPAAGAAAAANLLHAHRRSCQGFPCAVQLGPSMELHYHLSVTVSPCARA